MRISDWSSDVCSSDLSEGAVRTAPHEVEVLKALFASRRRIDAAAGRATAGPHRDDLSAVHAATGRVAARCSTGEQKAMLLSLEIGRASVWERVCQYV